MAGRRGRGGVTARAVIVAILLCALGLGALMWWLQTRAYYREVPAAESGYVTLVTAEGAQEPQPFAAHRAIDSASSPIRFRACVDLSTPWAEMGRFRPYEGAEPLNAPGWFDCFDARAIGEALEAGEARAVLSRADAVWGVDRVAAVFPDGRAFLWHQINRCGEAVFNGRPPPEGCPPPPEGARLNYAPE